MSSEKTVLNFAYGSNMFTPRIQQRVKSAKFVCIGWLSGHTLRWHKKSSDGSGKCDAYETKNDTDRLWGVVFSLPLTEKPALDEAEGLGKGYAEKSAAINTGSESQIATLYYATAIDDARVPYDWYKALVLAGAREHGLPEDYIRGLESVASIPDPDPGRARNNLRILDAATSGSRL